MTFTLTPYQATAVKDTAAALRDAQASARSRGKLSAIGLTAPTGAGKTVIATHLLEDLLCGNDEHEPNSDLTILWVTDDPALNRQTANKMLVASSSRITESHFVFMDSGFDKPRLVPGRIHFINTQKLGSGATSYQQGRDGREHGFWNAIAATIEASKSGSGSDFLLVIDEAHKGTGESKKGDNQKIAHRLIHGTAPGEVNPITNQIHPAAPVLLAITATPEKFDDSMRGAVHGTEKIQVPVAEVRESGLIKDKVAVRHPGEKQTSDKTLIGLAVEALSKSEKNWRAYYDAENAEGRPTPLVTPILVVQVKDGIKPNEMAILLDEIKACDETLTGRAVVHAFGEPKGTYDAGSGREVRYVAPERIQDDSEARVVIFKQALTTGWDCPRSEVMLSFRVAEDYTQIAQLIGRMVRTPLAKRIESDEALNKVVLYLPNYNAEQVGKIVAILAGAEGTGGGSEIELQPFDFPKRTTGRYAKRLPDALDLLATMPSVTRLKKSWRSETDRYMALASLLKEHKLDDGGKPEAQKRIVLAMDAEAQVQAPKLKALLHDVQTLDMSAVVWSNREHRLVTDDEDEKDRSVKAKQGDIKSLYDAAKRQLPDASAAWYWDYLIEHKGIEAYEARGHVAALCHTPEMAGVFKAVVEDLAIAQIAALRKKYESDVSRLDEPVREQFAAVWSPVSGVVDTMIEVPDIVTAATERLVKKDGTDDEYKAVKLPTYDLHLYADENGKFPAKLTSWEVDVLKKETAVESLVGWYRNPPRSKNGIAVTYEVPGDNGEVGLLYPDFVFIHAPGGEDGDLVLDIVDPHNHSQADTGPKWAGLTAWAQTNKDKVRRVVAVIKTGSGDQAHLLSLDLTKDGMAEKLKACTTQGDIDALFAAEASRF